MRLNEPKTSFHLKLFFDNHQTQVWHFFVGQNTHLSVKLVYHTLLHVIYGLQHDQIGLVGFINSIILFRMKKNWVYYNVCVRLDLEKNVNLGSTTISFSPHTMRLVAIFSLCLLLPCNKMRRRFIGLNSIQSLSTWKDNLNPRILHLFS